MHLARLPIPVLSPWVGSRRNRQRPDRTRARVAIVSFLGVLVVLHVAAAAMMETVRPDLLDPQYGKRIERLTARIEEHPERPVVVVLGSSRVAMGVRPQAWESARGESQPLLFNMGRLGGGPLFELLTLGRMLADGIRPDVVLIEYWPPLLHEAGPFNEVDRFDATRLRRSDAALIRDYHPAPDRVEREFWECRLHPVFAFRERWLAEIAPSWVPSEKRIEPGCRGLDGWGWAPGLEHDPVLRFGRLKHYEPTYREHFRTFHISPMADQALRECVAVARAEGVKVAFVFLPDSSEFRSWYPAEAERIAREHLHGLCRELGVPLIDARCTLAEESLADGIHLSPAGAAEFTRRLGRQLVELDWHAPPRVR